MDAGAKSSTFLDSRSNAAPNRKGTYAASGWLWDFQSLGVL